MGATLGWDPGAPGGDHSVIRAGYLTFVSQGASSSGKTQVWAVNGTRDRLGEIRWYGGWRQYVFYPLADKLFNPDCLQAIASFCTILTQVHRKLVQ